MSRRRMLAYTLCVVLFAATVALSIRLSVPPDPWAARLHPSTQLIPDVSVDGTTITVRSGEGQRHRYELYGTERGLVASESAPPSDHQDQ